MDDILGMLDELLAGIGDTDSVLTDVNFDDEVHWVPIRTPAELPLELVEILELTDVPPTGDADVADGVQWVAFPNPFQDGAAQGLPDGSAVADDGSPSGG